MLGLHCCVPSFSSCGECGLLFVAVRGLLLAVLSLCFRARALGTQSSVVVALGLSSCGSQALEHRLSSCGAWALLHGMWDLPRPGLEPVSPALTGGYLTTAPPGKPYSVFLIVFFVAFFGHLLNIYSHSIFHLHCSHNLYIFIDSNLLIV